LTRGVPLLAGLFLAALALRPQVVGIGPLLPSIRDDLGLSHAVAGLLGTIPVLCMGLFALPAGRLARR
jgi:MFS transporter, CP family, cyanate transporter